MVNIEMRLVLSGWCGTHDHTELTLGNHMLRDSITIALVIFGFFLSGCQSGDCRQAAKACADGFVCLKNTAGKYECQSDRKTAAAPEQKFKKSKDSWKLKKSKDSWKNKIRKALGDGPLLIATEGNNQVIRNLKGATFKLPRQDGVAIPDPQLDAIWYEMLDDKCSPDRVDCDYRLAVLDLQGGDGPQLLVKKLPRTPSLRHLFNVNGPPTNMFSGEVSFDLSKPKDPLKFYEGFDAGDEGLGLDSAEALKGVKWVKRATFDLMASRLAKLSKPSPCNMLTASNKIKSISKSNCEMPELCGQAQNLPWSPLQIVTTGHSCGDACYVDACLYDPRSKKFLNPSNPKKTMAKHGKGCELSSFSIVEGGQYWIHGDTIVAADGSRVMKRNKGQWFSPSCHIK